MTFYKNIVNFNAVFKKSIRRSVHYVELDIYLQKKKKKVFLFHLVFGVIFSGVH